MTLRGGPELLCALTDALMPLLLSTLGTMQVMQPRWPEGYVPLSGQ